MNIIMTHGYLLTGTGSNLYVRNLVKEYCAAGHTVYLVSQEPTPEILDFVEEAYTFDVTNTRAMLVHQKETPYAGTCKCFRPNLDGFLPVYVFDHYDGVPTVKEFPDCSAAEIERYITQNVTALETLLTDFQADVIQTNHTVMLPYIAAQLVARHPALRHVATVHGSALNFTVKKDPRFVQYAHVGLASAVDIMVDSKHAYEELNEFLEEHDFEALKSRVQIVPAGVDVANFLLLEGAKSAQIETFIEAIQPVAADSAGRVQTETHRLLHTALSSEVRQTEELLTSIRTTYNYRHMDQGVVNQIRTVNWEQDRVVLFVGKYLWTKGLYLMLLALPFILKTQPRTKYVFVGFGPFREIAELILNALATGRLDIVQDWICAKAPFLEGESGEIVPLLADILATHGDLLEKTVAELDTDLRDHVVFTGILTHGQLRHLLPCADVLVAPSVFPEAFGMVAIEAMACGVYPIVTYQSAFREITDEVRAELADTNLAIHNVDLDAHAPLAISANVLAYFELLATMTPQETVAFKQRLRDVVVQHYSWRGISEKYLTAYATLPPLPENHPTRTTRMPQLAPA